MQPFTQEGFPIIASGHNVYRRMESSPICTCADMAMAAEIAKRLNRDNQAWPETGRWTRATHSDGRFISPSGA